MASYDEGKTHKHINGGDNNSPQIIQPPADQGSPYRENATNISPMDIIPKIGGVKANNDITQGYTCIGNPTVAKGVGEFPNESIKPWRPKGRK